MAIVNIVLPVFVLIALGYFLRQRQFIRSDFNALLARFVYFVAAPTLIFQSTAQGSIDWSTSLPLIATFGAVTVALGFGVYALTPRMAPDRRGVFAQGASRSNTVFVGLPVVLYAYGANALTYAAVVIAFTVIVYAMLGVILLLLPHSADNAGKRIAWGRMLRAAVTNPLVLGCGLGLALSPAIERLPIGIDRALGLIGQTAAPLGLLSVGAELDFRRLRTELRLAAAAAALKLILYPLLVYGALYWLGLRGLALAVPVLLAACPTAVVSYVMAREMRGHVSLASAIVIGTTVASLLTLIAWLAVLRLNLR